MNNDDLAFAPVHKLAADMAGGALTSAKLTGVFLSRIASQGEKLHAFVADGLPVLGQLLQVRERRGLDPASPNAETDRLAAFDAAADLVEAHLDLGGWL